jgi:hypothetical protein
MVAASSSTATALTGDQAAVVIAITVGLILLSGLVVMLGRSITKRADPDQSFVRIWIMLALVTGLVLFWAVTFAVNDPTLQSIVFGALAAIIGAVAASHFSAKNANRARQPAPKLSQAALRNGRKQHQIRAPRLSRTVQKHQLSLTRYVILIMLTVGRWRRRQAHHDSVEFANAGPPSASSMQEISRFIPVEPPPELKMLTERRPHGNATLPKESETIAETGPDHGARQEEELDQAWRWTLALDAVVRAEILPRIKSVKTQTYGFVESHSAVRLAAIFYVRKSALFQAAPLFVEVGGKKFPVVIRPQAKDINTHTDMGFSNGQVTCAARLGNDYGVLTAAHVVGGSFKRGKMTVAQDDHVACRRAGPSSGCTHRVLAIDPIMDAVLIEAEIVPADYDVAKSEDEPGFNSIVIDSPLGPVSSKIIELEIPQGVIPVGAAPGDSPAAPALVFCQEPGARGWSGSMVVGKKTGVPYGMFLGIRPFYIGNLGKVELLRQIEMVWDMEVLKRRTE